MKLTSLSLAIVFVLVSLSCSRVAQFEASKVVDHSTINSLVQTAASGRKMRLLEGAAGAVGGVFRAKFEKELDVECDNTTRREFMSALRTATQNLLKDQSAEIHGWEKRGSDEDLNGFSWEYSWKGNNGILLSRYYPGASERGRLIVLCYEHTRAAPQPPRAAGY